MSLILIFLAYVIIATTSYTVAYGVPWRPQRVGGVPETARDRMERLIALGVTVIWTVTMYFVLATVTAR